MKTKCMLLIFCSGLFLNFAAQQYAIDKKATIISGMGIFSSQSGDLFEDTNGNGYTTVTFNPTVNHFVTKNFFLGGGFEISTESQGTYHSNAIGIGPQLGYALGGPNSLVYPYLDLGISYYLMNADYGMNDNYHISGSDIAFGFGVIVPVKSHIGLIFEGGYHSINLKDKDSNQSYSGNIFSLGLGVAGLLFQSTPNSINLFDNSKYFNSH